MTCRFLLCLAGAILLGGVVAGCGPGDCGEGPEYRRGEVELPDGTFENALVPGTGTDTAPGADLPRPELVRAEAYRDLWLAPSARLEVDRAAGTITRSYTDSDGRAVREVWRIQE